MEKADLIESITITKRDKKITFTLAGGLRGARRTIPIAISVFAVGLVFGVLARQAHLNILEAFLMSGLVFAGASQFVALSLWIAMPLPVITIILTTLVVNLRHVLMGASLRPWFSQLPPFKAYASVFFMVDESWAMSMSDFTAGGRDLAFLLGSGMILFVVWVSSTIIGHALGSSIQDPTQWGLDFAFTAVFLALLTGMWKGKSDLLPWAVAAIVAVATAHWLPGKWYILLGGLAGSITGAITHVE